MVEPQERSPGEQQAHDAYYETQIAQIQSLINVVIEANRDNETKLLAGTELLLKLTHNISKNPTESKYRTIRSTIPKIQNELFGLGGAVSYLLQALGFMKIDDEHYVFVGDYFKVLRKG